MDEIQHSVTLRPAAKVDQKSIRKLVYASRLNPLGLDWRRFTVAVTKEGDVIGCGQVKPRRDGSKELASITVEPKWRGQGVAEKIIDHFQQEFGAPLYLTCRMEMIDFYRKYSFRIVDSHEYHPTYFRRIRVLSKLLSMGSKSSGAIAIMVWD